MAYWYCRNGHKFSNPDRPPLYRVDQRDICPICRTHQIIKISDVEVKKIYTCPKCKSDLIYQKKENPQIWYCPDCRHTFNEPVENMIFATDALEKFLDESRQSQE